MRWLLFILIHGCGPDPVPPAIVGESPAPISPIEPTPMPTPPSSGFGVEWTDIRLPPVLGWVNEPLEDHGPAQGMTVVYKTDEVVASVFVYNRNQPGIRRDDAIVREELARAEQDLFGAMQQGVYSSVRMLGPGLPIEMGSSRGMFQASMTTRPNEVEKRSETYITTHGAFYVKVRITFHTMPPSSNAVQSVSSLVTSVGNAARP